RNSRSAYLLRLGGHLQHVTARIVRGAACAQAEEYREHDARCGRHRQHRLHHPDRARWRLSGAAPCRVAGLGDGGPAPAALAADGKIKESYEALSALSASAAAE